MYVQLDTKTVYTFMDSMVTIEKYVKLAKEKGYTHLGIMDSDTLYGAYSFIETCQREEIQPIVGCELTTRVNDEDISLLLVALNTVGYRNLLKISTARMMGKIEFAEFQKYVDGIAVILPEEYDSTVELEVEYYIGVSSNSTKKDWAKPILPIHTVRYFEEKQLETLQMLHAIRENTSLHQVVALPSHQYFQSPKEVEELFQNRFSEAFDRLQELVNGISYSLDQSLKLPQFDASLSAVEELRKQALAGLERKNLLNPIYMERLNHELAVIHQMGFDDYFLIVWDLLRFGRQHQYYMGMGRGSAVGSLVSYALEITGIDPVKHQLLFERFLNVERNSLPDIDIDIPDMYRSEFIRYVRNRYGSWHTAQIVTFSTFGARQAIRDVFKRFGMKEYELSQLTQKISFKDTLETAFQQNASFRQIINSKIEYQKAFHIAKEIEGQPRQTSIHAAGVVMSNTQLTDTIPLKKGEDMLITQYDAHAVEANGLLKMDFLGLRNLTFVQKMQSEIQNRYQIDFNPYQIDLEDTATLQLFAEGKTKGIFQFEQPGAIRLLKRVKPSCFEEVVATTSLNRPGASDYADNFVKRKFGQERVDLLDDAIASILEPTYGIMLYQEQVMQIAQVYAGFTLGKADILRRAMSKKDVAEMEQMKSSFVAGALKHGHEQQKAERIFAMMAKFAGYGFNRSHAYAYSALAFQLAYIKTHFPDVFFEMMLNDSGGDYLQDAVQAGFQVEKLRINTVRHRDKCEGNRIYLGLRHIKGLPKELSEWIVGQAPFKSVEDFILQLPQKWHKKDWLTPLIQIGLFDEFEANRHKIVANLDNLFVFVEAFGSFFAEETYSWTDVIDYTDSEKFEFEQTIIGIGISPHPLIQIRHSSTRDLCAISELVSQQKATVLAIVQDVRVIRTKKTGERMAFLQVSDTQQKTTVTLFPETYALYESLLEKGKMYYLTGHTQERDGQVQLILEQLEVATSEKFWILLDNQEQDKKIAQILEEFPGDIPVVLHYKEQNRTLQIPSIKVEKTPALEEALKDVAMKTVFR